MFWRKANLNERQPVLDLLKRLSNASNEIDRAADAMKLRFARMDNLDSAPQVMTAINDVLDTWVLREELFKHQMWRLKSNRDLLVGLTEGRATEEMNQEANKADRAYEKVLNQMSNSIIKLGKRYKISVMEFAQL